MNAATQFDTLRRWRKIKETHRLGGTARLSLFRAVKKQVDKVLSFDFNSKCPVIAEQTTSSWRQVWKVAGCRRLNVASFQEMLAP